MTIADALDLSKAMAALNCTAFAAWGGGVGTLQETRNLLQSGTRRENPEIAGRLG